MHLHSIHQPGASMESHIYNAQKLGMKYIHFTDHDTRTGRKSSPVEGFDFSRCVLEYKDNKEESRGWEKIGDPEIEFKNGGLNISGKDGDISGIRFRSDGKRHTWALLSDLELVFGFEYECKDNSRIVFDVTLSQRPPEHKEAHFRYVIGKTSEVSNNLFKEVPMPTAEDGFYRLRLSDDIEKQEELGGLDNTFATVSIITEGEATINLYHFEIHHKYEYNDLILRQRELAKKVGAKYGVEAFVTSEISGAGQHKNCFTSSVPIIDYYSRNYRMSEEEACRYLRSYGAVFSYNHPFEADRYKRREFTREEIEEIIAYESEDLGKKRVYGAQVMEVGFPEGRGLFTLGDYLKLWDNLSLQGVFITGDGDSDSHYSNRSWFDKNNFATWIGVDDSLEFPISEDAFNASLLSGNCYMGDPVRLKGDVRFFSGDRDMGSVIRAYEKNYTVSLRLEKTNIGSTVRFIKDGKVEYTERITEEEYQRDLTVDLDREISFVRSELYDCDGRCIMLTNPIYFVDQQYRGDVPGYRAGYIGSSRQKSDAALMNSEFKKEIEVPDWLFAAGGKRILHIGDTESRRYNFYRSLINKLRPDVIIHTGDMSDEVKAGRMSEVRGEYVFKIGFLAEIMRSSGAEIIIVPGNNDIKEEIEKLFPEAKILNNNSIVNIDGKEVRVGHQVMSISFDKDWSFYGHGFTGDEWDPSLNREGGELRFNACHGPVVASIYDGKFYQYSLKDIK